MTPIDKDLRALAEAATQGEWREYMGWVHPSFDGPSPQTTNADTAICEPLGPDSRANASHIAAWSPANVLKFIEAYEAMEAKNKALREALEPLIEIGNRRCCDAPEWRTDDMVWAMIYIADLRRARKALGAE